MEVARNEYFEYRESDDITFSQNEPPLGARC
jgi:hypothetical protein